MPNQYNPKEFEEKILKFWRENQIFEKSVENRRKQNAEPFIFYEGPPSANGKPGIHHFLTRIFKDVICRYKTMAGFLVERRAGWDTHGLPIEVEVEKELGLKSKKDIEKIGVAKFNSIARSSVWRYKEEWERFTERSGFWIDLKKPYITYDTNYIESLWWILKSIFEKKMLYQDYKVLPYCPRCGTSLSYHELAQPDAYKEVEDPSVYIKFKIQNSKFKINEYLLVWTTTPWTLPANVAIAVNPKISYTKYKIDNEYFWSYNPPPFAKPESIEVIEKRSGASLVGLEYEPLYNCKLQTINHKPMYRVYPADFVSIEEGTGFVHIAPAFGEDDMNLAKKYDLPIIQNVDEEGKFKIQNSKFKIQAINGLFVKSADKIIFEDLKNRNLLYWGNLKGAKHDYPHCWRCKGILIYYAKKSWFIRISSLKKELMKSNQSINWIPESIKNGRFGEWLREIRDWTLSRERFWGTPLPIWQCEKCQKERAIGSYEELNTFAYEPNKFFIMRHGQATSNVENYNASWPEKSSKMISRLTETGKKQVEQAAKKIAAKKIDIIFASPATRIKETVNILKKYLDAKVFYDERLQDIDIGVFNYRDLNEYHKFFEDPIEKFSKAPPGGENYKDTQKRMNQVIQDINRKYQNKNILIVGHGDPLWVLKGLYLNLPDQEILKLPYPQLAEFQTLPFRNYPRNQSGEFDPHRPYIDDIFLTCPDKKCQGKMSRVKDLIDVWFDSGAMPFASVHWPFAQTKNYEPPQNYPADYIAEGIDQTRGWFYTMLAIATLLEFKAPYKNVISLGLVLDEAGKKMSKSLGNAVNPWEQMDKYGTDSLRWYFYTINQPGEFKRFSEKDVQSVMRRVTLTLWNVFQFYEFYETKPKREPTKLSPGDYTILDKWILTRLKETTNLSSKFLESFDIFNAAKQIEFFIDDLSRWYLRRSRRRFQKPKNEKEKDAAVKILENLLSRISVITAPFIPFIAEIIYQKIKTRLEYRGAKNIFPSVHLADWPKMKTLSAQESNILKEMARARRIADLGLKLRGESGIKIRQPLAQLFIKGARLREEYQTIIANELNIKKITASEKIPSADSRWRLIHEDNSHLALDTAITSELKEEGIIREIIRAFQNLRQEARLKPQSKITAFTLSPSLKSVLEKNKNLIVNEINAKTLEFKRVPKFDAELETKIDNNSIWLAIKK